MPVPVVPMLLRRCSSLAGVSQCQCDKWYRGRPWQPLGVSRLNCDREASPAPVTSSAMAQINLTAAERDALLAALKSAAPQQKTLIGRLDGLRFNTRACVVCGAEFEATNPRKKTCSDACRQALSRSNRHATAVGQRSADPGKASTPRPSQLHRDLRKGETQAQRHKRESEQRLIANLRSTGMGPERIQEALIRHRRRRQTRINRHGHPHRHFRLTTPPIGKPSAREWLLIRLDAHPERWLNSYLLVQDNELNSIHRKTKLVSANSLIKADVIAFDSPARSESNRQQGLRSFAFAVHAPSGTVWDEGLGIPAAIGVLVQELLKGTKPQFAIGVAKAFKAAATEFDARFDQRFIPPDHVNDESQLGSQISFDWDVDLDLSHWPIPSEEIEMSDPGGVPLTDELRVERDVHNDFLYEVVSLPWISKHYLDGDK